MDHTEDLSARVLLQHILVTEPPRTPITRSVSKTESTSSTRHTRSSKKDAGAQTPKDILRRSLKHKMRESISRKSLPASRRTASTVLRRTNTPAQASLLFDEADTPRHILMNILQTEPVKSPVVHEKAVSEEPQLPSANSSITNKSPSVELSGLDLPDITIGAAASTAKGLSRKRPRRSLNVTAFEKRLRDGEVVENEDEESVDDHSSLSLSSSTSLSLKTPFAGIGTEKKGLRRRVSNRRKITEEEFGAAVNKRQTEGLSSFALVEKNLNETDHPEGLTLGLSKLSDLEVTNDIINCNTALYAKADAMTSNFSIAATQDKPTVMASQIQREIEEAEQSHLEREKSTYIFPSEKRFVAEPQNEECISQSEEDMEATQSQNKEGKSAADCEDDAAISKSEDEEEVTESQTDEVNSEEENRAKTQTEEEEEVVADSEIEEGAVDFQLAEEVVATSQSDEEGEAEQFPSDPAGNPQSEEEDYIANSQTEDENDGRQEEDGGEPGLKQLDDDKERISRRAHRSEAGLILPVIKAVGDYPDATDAGSSDGKYRTPSASDFQQSLELEDPESSEPHTEIPDMAEFSPGRLAQKDASCPEVEPDADKENSPHNLEATHDISHSGNPCDASSEEAEQPAEEEEEWEEEDSEEIPMKTPAFVREKLNFVHLDPLASPSTFPPARKTTEGSPAAKPKRVRQRKTGPAKKETGLPKSYLMGVFKHFAKTKVSADVYPVLKEIMDKFLGRLADDLETYAVHAKRKTIEVEDAELLLRRQGYVNDKVPVEVLIEKYLRMEQRKLLIPIATNGNVVIPKTRR